VHVADVMTEASITDSPTDTLRLAAERMWRQQTGSLVVMDGDRMVGIITERDILKAVAQGVDLETKTVDDVMTRDVITAAPDTDIHRVMDLMTENRIRHLLVVDGGGLCGMVSIGDVVNALRHSAEVENYCLHAYIEGVAL